MKTSKILWYVIWLITISWFLSVQNTVSANDSELIPASSISSFVLPVPKTNSICTQNYTWVVYKYRILIATAKTEEQKKSYRISLNTYVAKWRVLCSATVWTWTTTSTGWKISTGNSTAGKTSGSAVLPILTQNITLDNWIFVETNTGILKNYSSWVLAIVDNLTFQFKINFQSILQEMVSNGLLTTLDKATMRKKIILYFVEDCKNLNGKTTVEQWLDPTTNKVTKSNLVGILFKINVCNDTTIYPFLKKSVPEIITHELWHVYNFMHDKNADIFSSICRNGETLKSTCNRQSFVSDYAMLNSDEDYAETFTKRYRNTFPTTKNTQLLTKKNYFNQIQQR